MPEKRKSRARERRRQSPASLPRAYAVRDARHWPWSHVGSWKLFDFHLGPDVLQLLLDDFDVGLRHGFLHGRGRTLDQILGFLQPQAGDLADHLDHGDLLVS